MLADEGVLVGALISRPVEEAQRDIFLEGEASRAEGEARVFRDQLDIGHAARLPHGPELQRIERARFGGTCPVDDRLCGLAHLEASSRSDSLREDRRTRVKPR